MSLLVTHNLSTMINGKTILNGVEVALAQGS